jgi:hypothetical protein
MATTTNGPRSGGGDVEALATDPAPPIATPVMMTDAYVEISAANLSCLGMNVSIEPENKPIELVTFCGVKDYPGPVKWHFKAKLAQAFDAGATYQTLKGALDAYNTAGTLCPFKVRPYKSRALSATNPSFEGNAIPQPFTYFGGDAGTASEVDIDWILDQPPVPNMGPPATGATAGTPGSWTPAGAVPPSNVANLIAGTPNTVTANPTTAWTAGQYVQTGTPGTAGQAHWSGTAWVAGTA